MNTIIEWLKKELEDLKNSCQNPDEIKKIEILKKIIEEKISDWEKEKKDKEVDISKVVFKNPNSLSLELIEDLIKQSGKLGLSKEVEALLSKAKETLETLIGLDNNPKKRPLNTNSNGLVL